MILCEKDKTNYAVYLLHIEISRSTDDTVLYLVNKTDVCIAINIIQDCYLVVIQRRVILIYYIYCWY